MEGWEGGRNGEGRYKKGERGRKENGNGRVARREGGRGTEASSAPGSVMSAINH